MGFYIFLSFALFCISVIIGIISFVESKRDDIIIVDDAVDRERINRFLKLPESSRRRIDREVTAEIESGDYE